jgi:hypothetical protein
VLFIHGLESGPGGHKVRALRSAGFEVIAEQMPCTKKHVQQDPVAWVLAASAAVLVAGCFVVAGWIVAGGVALALLAARPVFTAVMARRIFRRSYQVQLQALAAHDIDIVVGSSFGGAVAVELLHRHDWSGPTLLLCPAHELLARRAKISSPPSLATLNDDVAAHVVVVHGANDSVVPLMHSRVLVAQSPSQLLVVDDDHRLSVTATPENLRTWVTRALAGTHS